MSLYNLRNPAVKRLMKEAEELLHPTDEYHAQPLEDNLFEWHFTLRGPPNTDYEGGIYHGRITLPPDYPMKPPSIILLTPNGRFETNKKICLSISGHHPESWQPSWSIRTALLAIIGFMPTHGNGALGSLDYTREERQHLASKSQEWQCSDCGYIKDIFKRKDSASHEIESDLKDSSASHENESDLKDSLHEHESHGDQSNDICDVSGETTASNLREVSSASDDIQSKCLIGEVAPSVHQRKSTSTQSESNMPTIPSKQNAAQHRPGIFSSVAIWLIILIFLFLCIRRLFSL